MLGGADRRSEMTTYPHTMVLTAAATIAGWLMMQAGLAKRALEFKRSRRACPSCGRRDACRCTGSA
jgi:hypothetical protein